MTPTTLQIIGTVLFAIAILHTFATQFFKHLAHTQPAHAGLWDLLSEVEVVFGFWAFVLVIGLFVTGGGKEAIAYVDSRHFTEPMFVFAIMVVAATRPIVLTATRGVDWLARAIPLPGSISVYCIVLTIVPLLGSFITEPAAMTLAALMLSKHLFRHGISSQLKYATLGVLFVNISIGGTLTPFAAPPVLMVAAKWQWDIAFMMTTFGWKAGLAVIANTLATTLLFRKQLIQIALPRSEFASTTVPIGLVVTHLALLVAIILFAHHPPLFLGLFLFFLGIAHAYQRYQDRLMLREGLLVAFFLAGLVILGGQQQWWLQPMLLRMNKDTVFFAATILTAITDNAALTYLGSLVDGLSDHFQYALLTGAVTGGGLTIIANAANPAGIAILREHFEDASVNPLGLLLAALPPTLLVAVVFRYL